MFWPIAGSVIPLEVRVVTAFTRLPCRRDNAEHSPRTVRINLSGIGIELTGSSGAQALLAVGEPRATTSCRPR